MKQNPSRRRFLEMIGLLAPAFLVRLPGIWQNLPYVFHWDEPTLVNLAVWIFTDRTPNPRFFNYPSGMIYLLALLFAGALLAGRVAGALAGWADGVRWLSSGTYQRPPAGEIVYRMPTRGVPVLYVLGRLVSAILGTLSVWWTFRLSKHLGGSRVAWLAGALLALNALHASHSALVTTDVACGAMLTWFLLSLFSGASPRQTGAALGLAAAFKYTGAIGLYLWPLGLVFPLASVDRRNWNRLWLRLIPWAVGTFLLLNPFVVLTPRAFLHGFMQEAVHMRAGTAHFGEGVAIGPTGPSVVVTTLGHDLGVLPLLGFAFAFAASAIRRRRDPSARPVLLVGAWCLLYCVQLMTWKTVYPRYLLPIWPALMVVAAWGWVLVVERLVARVTLRIRTASLATVLIVIPVVPGLLPLGRSISSRLAPDPRVEMIRVVERSLSPNEPLALETGAPQVGSGRLLVKLDMLGRLSPEAWRRRGVRYLLATGREEYLPAGSPESLLVNRRRIGEEARIVWSRGAYAILDLGEGRGSLEEAKRMLQASRAEEGRRLLESLCREDSTNSPAVMLLGAARLATGDTLGASTAYIQATRIDPTNPLPHLELGNLALQAHLWDAAIQVIATARSLSPQDPVAMTNLAIAHLYRAQSAFTAGRRADAARDLNEAALLARLAVSRAPGEKRIEDLQAGIRRLAAVWGVTLDGR